MRVPKWSFVFFTAKYKISKSYPNDHPFFSGKYKILKTVPKRPYLQRNTEFWKLYSNGHS